MPVADAQYLRCLQPGNLFGHRLQHHVLYFHRPLDRGLRVRVHAWHALSSSPPAKRHFMCYLNRTYHVLPTADGTSCMTDRQPFPTHDPVRRILAGVLVVAWLAAAALA